MTIQRQLIVNADADELASFVARRFIRKMRALINKLGGATVVLTGGSVGIAVLAAINASPKRDSVDWSKVSWWWGDERWLPRGDSERNERQAREALLNHIEVTESLVHPFPASDDGLDLDAAADAYASELAIHAAPTAQLPQFDVCFLGVGPDGHIASLFPDGPGIRERGRSVVAVRNSPKPPPERLSLTLPTINSADRVWVVLAGADKASPLGLALAGVSVNEVPVAGIGGRRRTVFFVDQAATAEVPSNLTSTEIFWTAADAEEGLE